jgi:hypothetical protein
VKAKGSGKGEAPAGKTAPLPPFQRHFHGPQALASLMAPLTRPVLRRLHPGSAQVMADWEALVGAGLAARTRPRRLERGVLTIACAGPVAMELTMLAPQVIELINAGLGRPAVKSMRFIQAALPAPPPPRPQPAPMELPPAVSARLEETPEGPLREALARLAAGVYRSDK